MFIKKIEKDDLLIWESLARSEFLDEDFCTKDYIIDSWNCIDGRILMSNENEWIGCFFSSTQQFDFNTGGVHFLQICIFPKYRGKGYSKHLMKIGFDRSMGSQKSACISSENTVSINLFLKYGFKKTGVYKTWDVYICDKNYYPNEFLENKNGFINLNK